MECVAQDRSPSICSRTWRAPSGCSSSRAAAASRTTALTWAPAAWASWTAKRPTPRRTGDQHPLGEHLARHLQGLQGGQSGCRQCGGLCIGHRVGNWRHPVGGNRDELRPGARLDQTDHPGADRRSAAVGGRAPYDAGHVPAGRHTTRQLLQVDHLAAVEGGRPNADQGLSGRWHRVRDIGQGDVRRGGGGDQRKSHWTSSAARRK